MGEVAPALLPPRSPIHLKGELQALLSAAERALARLDGAMRVLPEPEPLAEMYLRREVVISARLEGEDGSLHELLRAEAALQRRASRRRVRMPAMVRHLQIARLGLKNATEFPISIRLLQDLQRRLFPETDSSGIGAASLPSREIFGKPGGEVHSSVNVNNLNASQNRFSKINLLNNNLDDFMLFYNRYPELIKIAVSHAQFQLIKPFGKGNGVIARLLIMLLLHRNRLLKKPVLSISSYFARRRAEYDQALKSIQIHDQWGHDQWEQWLAFFLRAVIATSLELVAVTEAVLTLWKEHRMKIAGKFGHAAGNALRVLEYLHAHPLVVTSEVQGVTGTSFAATSQLVSRLVEQGVLEETTGYRRNRVYGYAAYLRLLEPRPSGDASAAG